MFKTVIKKNDNVVVITGVERGKRGKVLFLDKRKERVVVEGINKRKKFVRPSQENPKGGLISLEYPIHISNIMLFCDKCKKGVKLAIEIKNDNKIRVCKKCGKNYD